MAALLLVTLVTSRPALAEPDAAAVREALAASSRLVVAIVDKAESEAVARERYAAAIRRLGHQALAAMRAARDTHSHSGPAAPSGTTRGPASATTTAGAIGEETIVSAPPHEASAAPSKILKPGDGNVDWVRLSSGEWLQGELQRMRLREVEFDSEELGVVTFDGDKVVGFISPLLHTYVFRDGSSRVGSALLTGDRLILMTTRGIRQYERRELIAIVPGAQSELSYWSGRITLGASWNYGAVPQKTASAVASLTREGVSTRVSLGYTGSYGTTDGVETDKNHRGSGQLDVFLTDRFFLSPVIGNVSYDKLQNIGLRWWLGAGLGYTVFGGQQPLAKIMGLGTTDRWYMCTLKDFELKLEASIGYEYTRFRRVAPDVEPVREEPSVRLVVRTEFDLSDNLSFDGFYELYLGLGAVRNTTHHAQAVLSFDLIEDIVTFDLTLVYDRNESPETSDSSANGTARDSGQVIVGLGVEF